MGNGGEQQKPPNYKQIIWKLQNVFATYSIVARAPFAVLDLCVCVCVFGGGWEGGGDEPSKYSTLNFIPVLPTASCPGKEDKSNFKVYKNLGILTNRQLSHSPRLDFRFPKIQRSDSWL